MVDVFENIWYNKMIRYFIFPSAEGVEEKGRNLICLRRLWKR